MGRKTKKEKSYVTAQTYKINKKKSFKQNLEMYTKHLKLKHPNLTTKQYLKKIHMFVADQLRKKSGISQQHIVETTSKIKVCKKCDLWIMGTKKIIQCLVCQDYYHLQCVSQSSKNLDWRCNNCLESKNIKQSNDESTQSSEKIENCQKDNRNKNQKIVKCSKCKNQFDQCQECYRKSRNKISQLKQPSHINENKQYQISSKKRKQRGCHQQQIKRERITRQTKQETQVSTNYPSSLKRFGQPLQTSQQQSNGLVKEQIQQSTNASSIFPDRTKRFAHKFPPMTTSQIQKYKNSLHEAIKKKKMNYVENLKPSSNIQLVNDPQNSLDFGLKYLCHADLKKYIEYKAQPIGPFMIQYEEKWGFDVVADKDLPKGMIICQYVGDVYTHRQALKIDRQNDSIMQLFIGKNADQSLLIVPRENTNIARFINGINQSDPKSIEKQNVQTVRVMSRQGHPIVILYTCKAVKKGERLLYNYGAGLVQSKYDTSEYC